MTNNIMDKVVGKDLFTRMQSVVRVERKHGVHVSRIKSYFIRVTKSGSVMNTRTIIEFEN